MELEVEQGAGARRADGAVGEVECVLEKVLKRDIGMLRNQTCAALKGQTVSNSENPDTKIICVNER